MLPTPATSSIQRWTSTSVRQDYWQSSEWIGYNSIYDAVFDWETVYTGTSMERDRFFFTANEKSMFFGCGKISIREAIW